MTTKTPERHLRGFLFPFWHGGLNHRLVTDYSSLSNHLQMRWLITLATTAIIKDRSKSMSNTPFPYQSRGGNRAIISQLLRRRNRPSDHQPFCPYGQKAARCYQHRTALAIPKDKQLRKVIVSPLGAARKRNLRSAGWYFCIFVQIIWFLILEHQLMIIHYLQEDDTMSQSDNTSIIGIRTGAAYIRVSTDDQLELSPESQLAEIQAYCLRERIILPK